MSNRAPKGIVTTAELCTPLEGVRVLRMNFQGEILEETNSDKQGHWGLDNFEPGHRVAFTLEGFVPKTYNVGSLPEIVRLLDNKLIGYQKRLWFIPGDTVEVFVHAPAPYSVNLFCHGLNKESVLNLGSFDAKNQYVPDGYFVEEGLNWKCNFTYRVPSTAQPGIYSLLLQANGQEPFAIPMVISTPRRQFGQNSKILVLASTNTWQSYNIWGGRSRYRNFENGPTRDLTDLSSTKHKIESGLAKILPSNLKAMIRYILRHWLKTESFCYKKLTILRPFTNCGLEENDVFQPFTSHLAAGEWRLLAWLEREKIDYDIVSGAELHDDPDLLKHYRAIILSTHCEYWTREMYEGLKYYHENHHLWIMNISGNSMYREIAFFEDGSTRCVSLSFARSCADESQILGVRFTMDDFGTCAPYKILKRNHWAFNNICNIKRVKTFGELSLNQDTPRKYSRFDTGRPGFKNPLKGTGASGWETDKFCKTTSNDIEVIAKGLNKKGGADMVIREPSGTRGGMFSASSVTFSGCLLIDDVASTLAKNVISTALDNAHLERLK